MLTLKRISSQLSPAHCPLRRCQLSQFCYLLQCHLQTPLKTPNPRNDCSQEQQGVNRHWLCQILWFSTQSTIRKAGVTPGSMQGAESA